MKVLFLFARSVPSGVKRVVPAIYKKHEHPFVLYIHVVKEDVLFSQKA